MNLEAREYTTRASAHGMAYVPIHPTVFDMTYAEAEAEVHRWAIVADTVGGDAIIVRRRQPEGGRE